MKSLCRSLIARAVPAAEREWVLGDIDEEYAAIVKRLGSGAARRWLITETARVVLNPWRERRQSVEAPVTSRGASRMQTLARDTAFAFRSIRRSPGFAAAAILTIALGAGANAAVTAVTYGILFKPLPYPQPDRLVAVWPLHFVSQVDLRYIREHATGLQSVAAIAPGWTFSLTGAGDPRKINVDRVSANVFDTLGTPALLGRTLHTGEDTPGSPATLVLTHRFWLEHFGGDRAVVGRVVQLDGQPHEIVGVMPAAFEIFRPGVDAWAPLPADRAAFYDKLNFSLLVGRLSPGVSLAGADAAFRAMMPAMRTDLQYPEGFGRNARLEDLRQTTIGPMRASLALLMGIVTLVLLIAGANVGTLAVARATSRARELAVHTAVGASRTTVARLQLLELLIVAVAGGAVGLALASIVMPALVALLPANTPRTGDLNLDGASALFVLAASVFVALVFGAAPSIAASRTTSVAALREGATTGGAGVRRLRGAMVSVQIALALVLAIGAGLMLTSFWRLQHVDAGLDVDRVLTLRLQPPARYNASGAAREYYRQVLGRIGGVAGVSAVGAIQHLPFSGINWVDGYDTEAHPTAPGTARPTADLKVILGDYFHAVGQPIIAGRAFSPSDEQTPDEVLIVNARLAASLFGAPEGAIGQRVRTGRAGGPWRTIVGVVGDVRTKALDVPPDPELYEPIGNGKVPALMLAMRADDPLAVAAPVREAVWSVDRTVPISDLEPMRALVGRTLAQPRLLLSLLGAFAVTGLLLAAIGVYGVVAFAVTRRRREVGIRIALGAARSTVIALMLRESAFYAAAGVVGGIAVSLGCARMLQTMLYGISATNVATYATLAVCVAALVLVASYIPARRAADLNPTEALRGGN